MDDAADGGGAGFHAEDRARRRRRLGAAAGGHHLHRGAPLRRRLCARRYRPPQRPAHAHFGHHDGTDHRTRSYRRDRRRRCLRVDAGRRHGDAALRRRRRADRICRLFARRTGRGGQGRRVRYRLCRRRILRFSCDRAGQRLAGAAMRRLLAPAILGRGDIRTWPGSGGGFSGARSQLRRKARRIAGARCCGCCSRRNCFPAMPRRPLCRAGSEVAAILA